jgi:hypothetical protein
MKIAPVSADLLIKLTIVAAAVGALIYAGKRAANIASTAWEPLSNAIVNTGQAITPWNPDNVVNTGVNKVLFPSGNNTLGGWLYDATHADPVSTPKADVLPRVDAYNPPAYDPTPGIY